jgi:hypothetical protein
VTAAVLVGLATPGWPATAAHAAPGAPAQGARPPGVPPQVDMARLPNPNDLGVIGPRQYDATVPGVRLQVSGPSQDERPCIRREQAGDPTVEDIPLGQARMRLPELRKFGRGAGQVIAVIDTGVVAHPRLAGRLLDGGDYVLDKNPFEDCDGHGTIVAGIIAASDDPATGFAGVAPDARIMSVRQSSQIFVVKVRDEGAQQETSQLTRDRARGATRRHRDQHFRGGMRIGRPHRQRARPGPAGRRALRRLERRRRRGRGRQLADLPAE